MAPHQQRVVDEKAALDEKIATLGKFLCGEFIKSLPQDEQARLSEQFDVMQVYSNILGARIAAF